MRNDETFSAPELPLSREKVVCFLGLSGTGSTLGLRLTGKTEELKRIYRFLIRTDPSANTECLSGIKVKPSDFLSINTELEEPIETEGPRGFRPLNLIESPREEDMIVIEDRFYTDPETFEKIKRNLGEEIKQDSYFYYITKNLYVASETYKNLEAALLEVMRHNERLSLFIFNEDKYPDLVGKIRDIYKIDYLPALIVSSEPITHTTGIVKQKKSITLRRDDMLIEELRSDKEKLKELFDELHELSKRDELDNRDIFGKKMKKILGKVWDKVSISPP